MDFDFSKPQKLLRGTVKEFLTRHCPLRRARDLMATSTAFDPQLWEGLADQGWTALTLPETHEGLGLGAVDLMGVAEVMGSFCLPGPFLANLWGSEVIAAAGHEEYTGKTLPRVAAGEAKITVALLERSARWEPDGVELVLTDSGGEVAVTGEKLFVSDAEVADTIVVVGRLAGELAVVAVSRHAEGVTVAPMAALDATRKLYTVTFTGATADAVLARGGAARKAIEHATRLGTIAVCGDLLGGMQWMLDTTVEYAKSREQFGRPIGSFQAVAHMCSTMLYFVESARSAAYYAAWALSVDHRAAAMAVAIAKAYCSDAAREVCNLAIQAHGGIGFTWEHDLNLFYRRAKVGEILFGDASFHRERIAAAVLDEEGQVGDSALA